MWGSLRVVGDDAAIAIKWMGAYAGSTLSFVLDETGVSPIEIAAWLHLENAHIDVEGSAYKGGPGDFLLLDSINLASVPDTNSVTVSGFHAQGLEASVVADQENGKDWVQLVLKAHDPETVHVQASTRWSTLGTYGNDDYVIASNVTVTVDDEAYAGSLQLEGTLLVELPMADVQPMTVLHRLNMGEGGRIEIDGRDYEGFDGYFLLIACTDFSEDLTHHVVFTGFGSRAPSVVIEDSGLWLRLVAPPSYSDRLCSLVPDSTVVADWSNSTFTATRHLQPTVSAWTPSFHEAHVQDTTLSQTLAGNDTLSWELRTARGGNLYSLRTPVLGETVPPSWREDRDSSPWNDEVWQGVAVDSSQNDTSSTHFYFTHQSGVYLKDPILTKPFYSPQVAAHLDLETRSFTTVNWLPQAHVNIYTDAIAENDFKSYVLMYTRYRDLGQGLIEVSLGIYNYGPDILDFLNMPWGGVRRTSMEYAFMTEPGGVSWSEPAVNPWGGATNLNTTGGWMGYSAAEDGSTPSMGFVYGLDHAAPLPKQLKDGNVFRWGYAGGKDSYESGEADWRNYFVTSVIRRYELNEGNGVWSRFYFLFGDHLHDLSDRIAARGLVDAELTPFSYAEDSTPWVAYRLTGSGKNFRIHEDGRSPDFFLYAHPVEHSVPVFEVIEKDQSRYLTWNPYSNGIVKPYDGTLAGLRLLGFALPSSETRREPDHFLSLESMMSGTPSNYRADGKTLLVRNASPIETWRVEHFGVPDDVGDGANAANPDLDQLSNLYEYAMGGDPTNPASTGYVPFMGPWMDQETNWFEVVYARRRDSATELHYSLETSSNLLSNEWYRGGYLEVSRTGALDDEFEAVTNRFDTTQASNLFIRVMIDAL